MLWKKLFAKLIDNLGPDDSANLDSVVVAYQTRQTTLRLKNELDLLSALRFYQKVHIRLSRKNSSLCSTEFDMRKLLCQMRNRFLHYF